MTILENMQSLNVTANQAAALEASGLIYRCDECVDTYHLSADDYGGYFLPSDLEGAWKRIDEALLGVTP